jgi:ligand-binding sensor domain-containing protein
VSLVTFPEEDIIYLFSDEKSSGLLYNADQRGGYCLLRMMDDGILRQIFSGNSRLFLLFILAFSINSPARDDKSPGRRSSDGSGPKILFNRIPTELGLSQNVITCRWQDKAGFLWFGTKDGLNRFDGYQFKVYRQNPNDPTSISDSSITAIFEDKKGRMWVGTENGLNLFDRTHEIFYRFLPDANNSNSLNHPRIREIAEDKQGAIWISTPNGINKLDFDGGENPQAGAKFSHFNHDPNNPESLSLVYTGQFTIDENGVIWILIGGTNKVYYLSPSENYAIKHVPIKGLKENQFFVKIYIGRNGKIWLATKDSIFELNPVTSETQIYEYDYLLSKTGMTIINSVLEDNNGNIWFGGYWGLARLNPSIKKFVFFPASDKENPENINPLLSYGVNSILEDRSGAIWFGTNGKGLIRFDRQAERFAHSGGQSAKLSLWRGTSVRTLVELDHETILLGSAGGGLLQINRTSNG